MLAPPNCVAGQALRLRRPTLPTPFFFQCVSEAIEAIEEYAPDALTHVDVGVEEVPTSTALWSTHMPLACAIEPDATHLAQVILFRRPIELRAYNRSQLRQLVFRALVEQVSGMTGISVDTLDPKNIRGD